MIVDTNKDTLAVYVGRFQIPHIGHAHIVRKGLEIADRVLIVLGSANESPSFRNPFSVNDRIAMLRTYFNYATGLTMTSNKFHNLFGKNPRDSKKEKLTKIKWLVVVY